MSVAWNSVRRLPEVADVARWELEARVQGVEIEHLRQQRCHNFDSVREPDSNPGVFRHVGRVRFNKRTRRWMAIVNSDCSAREATLAIHTAVAFAHDWGTKPGQKLRSKLFKHFADHREDSVAQMRICYRLSADDLLKSTQEAVVAPDSVASIAYLIEGECNDLRGAAGVGR